MNIFTSNNPNPNPNPNPSQNPSDNTPWMITTAAKAMGTIAGLISILFGFFDLFDVFSIYCILGGAILLFEGLIISLIESPCFFTFLDFAYMPSKLFENKPHWIKATLYLCFAFVPFLWCTGFTTFISCSLIFVTSALYLLIALGKKATAEEMRIKAATGNLSVSPSAVLVNNEELPKQTPPPPPPAPTFASGNVSTSVNLSFPNEKAFNNQGPIY